MTKLVFYYQNTVSCPAYSVLESQIRQHGLHAVIHHFDEFRTDAYVLADSPSSSIVAIDYDNTITADPEFYIHLIAAYRAAGWEPVVCSMRCADPENLAEIRDKLHDPLIPVYTTDGQSKRSYLLEQGIHISLWIDDFFPGIACPGAWILQVNGINY